MIKKLIIFSFLFYISGCTQVNKSLLLMNDFLNPNPPIYESNPEYLTSDFMLSYYSPGVGTFDVNYSAPAYSPSLSGEALSDTVIILNNIGRYIVAVDGLTGAEKWRKYEPNETPQSLFVYDENVLGYGSGQSLVLIDKFTGQELSRSNIFNRYFKWIKKYPDKFLICFDEIGIDTVVITDLQFNIQYSCPVSIAYSRGADLLDNKLLVADTFNHRVLLIDITTNQILFEIPEYFPNAAEFIDQDNIYILGEHSNRLYKLNLSTGFRDMILSSHHAGMDNPYLEINEIMNIEHSGVLAADPQSLKPYSKASTKYSGPRTLYSPNGFSIYLDTILISDTDNHRVIEITKNGRRIIREINGLNNPVSAIKY